MAFAARKRRSLPLSHAHFSPPAFPLRHYYDISSPLMMPRPCTPRISASPRPFITDTSYSESEENEVDIIIEQRRFNMPQVYRKRPASTPASLSAFQHAAGRTHKITAARPSPREFCFTPDLFRPPLHIEPHLFPRFLRPCLLIEMAC